MNKDEEVSQLKRRLVSIEAQRLYEFDCANPDVGMPYPYSYFEHQAMKNLGYTEADLD